ncbi:hypothetical protein GDO81_009934 [Engystomops pustulosus]|uniref:Uncharacterized protein n=1 Tax=Engystomops pustulosus TaxID=76066 RepID=A0AAV7BVD2_ENGPU|nr:hypothetical protein GDO81_009934 [Engystomops pustulosus]
MSHRTMSPKVIRNNSTFKDMFGFQHYLFSFSSKATLCSKCFYRKLYNVIYIYIYIYIYTHTHNESNVQ